jgi:hypothetical protein
MRRKVAERMGVSLTPETRSQVAPEHRKPLRVTPGMLDALPDGMREVVAEWLERPGVEVVLLPSEGDGRLVAEVRNAGT